MLNREHRERLVLIMKCMRQGSDDGRAEPVTNDKFLSVMQYVFDVEIPTPQC